MSVHLCSSEDSSCSNENRSTDLLKTTTHIVKLVSCAYLLHFLQIMLNSAFRQTNVVNIRFNGIKPGLKLIAKTFKVVRDP